MNATQVNKAHDIHERLQLARAAQIAAVARAEKNGYSDSEAEEAWQKADAEVRELTLEAQALKVWDERRAALKTPDRSAPVIAAASPGEAFSVEERQAWNHFLYTGDRSFLTEEQRTLTTGSSGAPIPQAWWQEIVEKKDALTWLSGLATQITVPMGVGQFNIPNESTIPSPAVVAENPGSDQAAADPTFGSQLTVIPRDMLVHTEISTRGMNSSNPMLGEYVQRALARGMAKTTETYGLAGTGTGSPAQPTGVQEAVRAAARLSGGSAASFTGSTATDVLHDVFNNVGEQYRLSPRCAWVGASTGMQLIRKLKDGSNRYYWKPGEWNADIRRWNPTELLDRPAYDSAYASYPTPGAAVVPFIVFGDWSYFHQFNWPATGLVVDPYTKRRQLVNDYSLHAVVDFRLVNTDAFYGHRFTS